APRAPARPVPTVDDEATLRRTAEDLAREDEWSGEVATLIRNRPGAVTAAAPPKAPAPKAPTPPPTPPPKPTPAPKQAAAPKVVAKVTPDVEEELVLDDPTANVPGGAAQLTKALAEKAPAPKKAAPAPKKAPVEAPPQERSILGPVALALVAGMMVGALVGGLGGGIIGSRLFPTTVEVAPPPLPAPSLRLSAPPGSKVTLDGEALILNNDGEAEVPLTAGDKVTLRVEPTGGSPYEERLTPEPGQIWVVQIVPSTLSTKASKR
ncbi:hypothetical protein L6R49_26105, partial [Myxococcota bacterium]|nr:hypothetical protein [Myxococcota bacterium]